MSQFCFPTWQRDVVSDNLAKYITAIWIAMYEFTINAIARAHLDFVKCVQNVKFRQCQLGE